MKKTALLPIILFNLTACSQGMTSMIDRSHMPCGNKPNCVSTQDTRAKFALMPYTLSDSATIDAIEQAALALPGAKTAVKQNDYLRIECTSKIMRFVDDLELKIEGNTLLVRSESRVGYSDFGVNRKRADQLRTLLIEAKLVK
ncbi:hypothetical protein BS333_02255 [Vibrio azureus]|uniref:DUF1499 domain-containing protein n=1 Tax=Vibrio azureus NBRC 104587 TaxID=1219077 RepID=U3AQX5_9VIBR|nr:DUF1499 domain-containing protein [Vibrio azureus]AUI87340.1 hypothetical protein BS333_02255 [Vibrio azureus]GAD76160.1 hypothetical protein VAZ01S_038_00390 [Vibrio azureus NBRC 104587]